MSVRQGAAGSTSRSSAAQELPPPLTRWIVSGIILVHFVAIFTTVVSAGSPNFPPAPLAVKANLPFRPYLQAVFLANPYRFYAPNPGPTPVFWFRLKYQYKDERGDDVVQWRWVEMPDRAEFTGRMPYQRHLSVTMLFDNHAEYVPTAFSQFERILTEEGKLVLSSYARRAARSYPLRLADGREIPVKAVQFYSVYHRVLHPDEIKDGWDTYDLRLYSPCFYGEFTPEGYRVDSPVMHEGRQVWLIQERSISELAAQILFSDLYPVFRKDADAAPVALMERLGTPTPIRKLLERFPELADPDTPQAELKDRIEKFVLSGPKTAARKTR